MGGGGGYSDVYETNTNDRLLIAGQETTMMTWGRMVDDH